MTTGSKSCPTLAACALQDENDPFSLKCAGGIETYLEKGENWDYTNGATEGFSHGKVSYHFENQNVDIINVCTAEGDYDCELLGDEDTSSSYIGCTENFLFEWTDYTVRLDEEWVCQEEETSGGGGS
ncbi:hypothetical protein Poly59_13900 [Rubripirellula reticaptiva]|uniref:Uncharacterized protein n=1 Tax=Rubripirellula reticaptiva TaxID=2528013 RepID=A0A5C6F3D6_9BACT|nr:hypothetical protein Poly59_13900 [Rubripirellula reticaptiva]